MAGRPTWQAGQKGRQANEAVKPTRQSGQQGRQTNMAGRLIRPARPARSKVHALTTDVYSLDICALTANIFAAAINRANIKKQGKLGNPLSSLPKLDIYGKNF